jgi:class 3 adenylate cyclase/tetratricopeptide (TPR) repeat protein
MDPDPSIQPNIPRSQLAASLAAYIPMDRRFALAEGRALPDRTRGAALFADVTGFTQVSVVLAQELGSQRGAEELTGHLNRIFGALIAEVHRYHGSIVSFAGDAITCWFDRSAAGGDERGSTRLALTCALMMQATMRHMEAITTPSRTVLPLTVKIAVTAGEVHRFQVSDNSGESQSASLGHQTDTLAGSLLDRLTADQVAHPGEVVVDQTTLELLGHEILFSRDGDRRFWRTGAGSRIFAAAVTGLKQPADPTPWPPAPELSPEMAGQWMPRPVFQRLERGEGEFLSELRLACSLFLRFDGIDYDNDPQSGEKLDRYVSWVGSVVNKHNGHLIKLTIGDKGCYFQAAFGVLQAFEDDAALCTAAAIELLSPPADLSFIHSIQIGLSRGQARSGAYGSPTRRTYGVHSRQVNIAARLMMLANPGQILATEAMARAAAGLTEFQEFGPLAIKGLDQPLLAFEVCGKRPYNARFPSPAGPARAKGESAPIIGRSAERSRFAEQLRALQDGRRGQAIVEGEAGIGKSRLMEELVAQGKAAGLEPLLGAGLAIEQTTPYHAWLPVLATLFNVAGSDEPAALQEAVISHLADESDQQQRAPLLNDILPMGLADNELTAAMTGEIRAKNTLDLLVALLKGAQGNGQPMMIVIDDAHWLDSASWSLLERVRRDVSNLLLLVVTRPMGLNFTGRSVPAEYRRLLDSPSAQFYELGPMPAGETLTLVARRLGVRTLPDPVSDLINQAAEGHPFFSEEIAFALRDAGLIRLEDGQAILAEEADLKEISFPDTVQGIITSRIDMLQPGPELALKVASVIGRIFPLRMLRQIHPVEVDRPLLPEYMTTLARMDITPLETPEPDASYIFRHAITQDVAYGLLLFGQRRKLHQSVAAWYEKTYADDLSHYYPLLAYHWGKAGIISKTIECLDLASEGALRSYANQEAVELLTQVLELAGEVDEQTGAPPPISNQQKLKWLRQLGQAYLGLGRLDECRRTLERMLDQAGYPAPKSLTGLRAGLVKHLLIQLSHRLRPSRVIGRASGERATTFLEVARAHQQLVEIYYFANERTQTLFAALNVLNASEWAGSSPELVRAYANMAMMAGLVPWHGMAEAYSRRATEMAERVGDPPALAWAHLLVGTYQSGVGGFQIAIDYCERARDASRPIGDTRVEGLALGVEAAVLTYIGELKESRRLYSEWYELARESSNLQHQAMGLFGQGLNMLPSGGHAGAAILFEQGIKLLSEEAEPSFENRTTALRGHGQLALARLRLGDQEGALQSAAHTLKTIRLLSAPKRASFLEVFSDIAEVYLAIWEMAAISEAAISADGAKELAKAKALAKESIAALEKSTGAFFIFQPRTYLWQGVYDWLDGEPKRARRSWEKSLTAAQRLQMPFDEALAHYEIGRHAKGDERQAHLNRALEGFEALGASFYVAKVRSIL